jgi:hypothetical protein
MFRDRVYSTGNKGIHSCNFGNNKSFASFRHARLNSPSIDPASSLVSPRSRSVLSLDPPDVVFPPPERSHVNAAMSHTQRRLASAATKLASVPLSSLKKFPPKEALTASSSSTFSPETWAALQPPPPSALSALSHRIGFGSALQIPELEQACTHPSVLPLYAKRHSNQKPPPANGNLSNLGNSLLGLFASEFVVASYPHLPTRVVKAAVSAYVGPSTCANVATEVGAAPLLRWCRTVRLGHPLPFFLPFGLTQLHPFKAINATKTGSVAS